MSKHRLILWPNPANEPVRVLNFKCVKCTKGGITLSATAVRGLVAGEKVWADFLVDAAFGTWGTCREDNPQLLESFNAFREAQAPAHHPYM